MNHQTLLENTFVNGVQWFHELESTNTYAISQMKAIVATESLPLLIGANLQKRGRGRGKNIWWADDGALTFSLVLQPETLGICKEQWPLLSLTVGLSVCLALNELHPHQAFQLKWPNDVYASGRKICGVLNETIPEHPDILVIGVGINMNNSLTQAPAEIQALATSLVDLTGQTQVPEDLLIQLIQQLETRCQQLSEKSAELPRMWKENCYLSGTTFSISDGSKSITGSCLGIDEDGALRVQTESGEQRFFAGVVDHIER